MTKASRLVVTYRWDVVHKDSYTPPDELYSFHMTHFRRRGESRRSDYAYLSFTRVSGEKRVVGCELWTRRVLNWGPVGYVSRKTTRRGAGSLHTEALSEPPVRRSEDRYGPGRRQRENDNGYLKTKSNLRACVHFILGRI